MKSEVRIRLGSFGRQRFEISNCSEAEATRREKTMRDVASDMTDAGLSAEAVPILKRMGTAADAEAFKTAVKLAEGLCSGRHQKKKATGITSTVRQVGEDWTSGRLHARFPDQVKAKRTADHDEMRLRRYVYPVLADRPVASITLDDCEAVMAALPKDLKPLTRRAIGQAFSRLLGLCVYPLRLIETSPIPKGFLPKGGSVAKVALFPDEDRALLGCEAVPLPYRLLWGFLAREGLRSGEARALRWEDVDVARGAVRLDENKTDDPRAWALDAGVARVLRALHGSRKPTPADYVLTDEHGRQVSEWGLAKLFRRHLEAAGLRQKRPELFKTTENRLRIRVHDLRGTFVTVNLANNKTEAWISDRTGHKSSQMINEYKRSARTFAELDVGELAPLDFALPELSPVDAIVGGLQALCRPTGAFSGGPTCSFGAPPASANSINPAAASPRAASRRIPKAKVACSTHAGGAKTRRRREHRRKRFRSSPPHLPARS